MILVNDDVARGFENDIETTIPTLPLFYNNNIVY